MQVHSEGAVRHAEKRRHGTCEFANRIARITLEKYEATVPKSYRDVHKQTCVAAIVACFSSLDDETPLSHGSASGLQNYRSDHMQVMGLGVGTKFLSSIILREERNNCTRIRDCHAEVLARRAFRRQLLHEIKAYLNDTPLADTWYVPVLERIEHGDQLTESEAKRLKPCTADNDDQKNDRRHKYRLKPGVTLHFYASSAPCGNATLKKFVKMEKETFDSLLPPNQWPQQMHTPIAAHSLRLGQFALLVKKDSSSQVSADDTSDDMTLALSKPISSTTENGSGAASTDQLQATNNLMAKLKAKQWPYRQDDSWCPPSCSITNYNKGSIHSCSDKICRWNCLGLQGSLLMSLLEEPLYMTTLTVGRKFSKATCQRAVCCRAEGFKTSESKYRLNHPVLMETNVYMDETGTHSMEGVKVIGQDAAFDASNSCWVWWPGKSASSLYAAECIDGKTGFTVEYDKPSTASEVSEVSNQSYVSSVLEILSQRCSSAESTHDIDLIELASLKQQLSPDYQAAKATLLRHRVFREWSCRHKPT